MADERRERLQDRLFVPVERLLAAGRMDLAASLVARWAAWAARNGLISPDQVSSDSLSQ